MQHRATIYSSKADGMGAEDNVAENMAQNRFRLNSVSHGTSNCVLWQRQAFIDACDGNCMKSLTVGVYHGTTL